MSLVLRRSKRTHPLLCRAFNNNTSMFSELLQKNQNFHRDIDNLKNKTNPNSQQTSSSPSTASNTSNRESWMNRERQQTRERSMGDSIPGSRAPKQYTQRRSSQYVDDDEDSAFNKQSPFNTSNMKRTIRKFEGNDNIKLHLHRYLFILFFFDDF